MAEQPAPGWLLEWPQTDFSNSSVAFDEILSGGPPKDGIPAIDAPQFVALSALDAPPEPQEPVMSVEIGGEARAYPLSVLIWHEIVNDTLAGQPIAVTYCPLCNSGIVFDRRVNGAVTTFGTTGKLRNSDLVMYDRASESWWQQFDGQAIIGARRGTVLTRIASRLESFAEFAARNPEGMVLVPPDAGARLYGRNPYVGYDSSAQPFLYSGDYDGPGTPLMRVVAIDGRAEAWSLDFIREAGSLRVDDLEIRWTAGQASALDAARVAAGRDVGTVTVERITAAGAREIVPFHVPFAFAFAAFNPGAPIRHN
jgi:hypothetical protein